MAPHSARCTDTVLNFHENQARRQLSDGGGGGRPVPNLRIPKTRWRELQGMDRRPTGIMQTYPDSDAITVINRKTSSEK